MILLPYRTYREHGYLATSPHLSAEEKNKFNTILARRGDTGDVRSALLDLSYYLFQHHGTKVWLLIDEYDTPMHSAFVHGYYQEIIDLMRGLLSPALKTNSYLEKAVITGILRIAKESLFSGLNNVKIYTLLQSEYGEYFGFTQNEVDSLLHQASLDKNSPAIRDWYNGYLCGKTVIYNPWSIVNCISQQEELRPYWVNTSSNDLIKLLLARGDSALKENLLLLVPGQPIETLISENMVFGDLERDQNAVWSLMLFSGYLKATEWQWAGMQMRCSLLPPNYEVKILFESIIQNWLAQPLGHFMFTPVADLSSVQDKVYMQVEENIGKSFDGGYRLTRDLEARDFINNITLKKQFSQIQEKAGE